MSRLRLYCRLAALLPVTLAGIPLQWLALRTGGQTQRAIPLLYHRTVCALLGIRRIERGHPPRGAALILSNHVSWLDICVLSALTPLSFIAKAEVGTWPVVSLLARLQRTVFIDRTRRTDTARANGAVAQRLKNGDRIVLFAEGTTGDGIRVLPFRSALVGAARDALLAGKVAARADATTGDVANGSVVSDDAGNVILQPLSITYVRRGGLPLTRGDLPGIAWHGDMDLAPHLAGVLSGGPIDVVLTWGAPIVFNADSDRKQVTRLAEQAVRLQVRQALADARGI